jgi:hypothetical protein
MRTGRHVARRARERQAGDGVSLGAERAEGRASGWLSPSGTASRAWFYPMPSPTITT